MKYAKKSLGQNFLRSQTARRAMVEAGEVDASDTVLEIGPGRGALTEMLLATGVKVIAIEKDDDLINFLAEKFAKEIKEKRFQIVHEDILQTSAKKLKLKNFKLVANIPYYITGAVIRKFLEEDPQPALMALLVQKEVGERIAARDGKESLLSIAVKAYANPKYVMKVSREAFTPSPNVDSAIVAFRGISKKFFKENKISEEQFFEIVRAGFAHKRKKLGGNLKSLKEKLNTETFDKLKEKRAEDIALLDWAALVRN
jgi:16S rRNA (adenine1518-N6/adenine1519-N6)-dimethyltransferase